jgi:hypothetical protein
VNFGEESGGYLHPKKCQWLEGKKNRKKYFIGG